MGQSSQSGVKLNDFHNDLRFSLAARDETFWRNVYEKAFPNMTRMFLCRDLDLQRRGIDRLIRLTSGKLVTVDEKKRRKNYGDILLEYLSNDVTGAPGWIEKDLAIDWLAYAFMDNQRVYLLNWPMLRRTWEHFGDEWKEYGKAGRYGFKIVRAKNYGYTTHSLAVPTQRLMSALSTATVIQLPQVAARQLEHAA